jgi:hypothetical protein
MREDAFDSIEFRCLLQMPAKTEKKQTQIQNAAAAPFLGPEIMRPFKATRRLRTALRINKRLDT